MKFFLKLYFNHKIKKLAKLSDNHYSAIINLRNWAGEREISLMKFCGILTEKDYYYNDFNLQRNYLSLEWAKKTILKIRNK